MADIFCTMLSTWESEGTILFENENAYSRLSITPAMPGHALVIPKKHVEYRHQLRGRELEDFVDAVPRTLQVIQTMYDRNPEKIVAFYEALRRNQISEISFIKAGLMLDHPHLRVRPLDAFNGGYNQGKESGQTISHFHEQLFLTREQGLGIATAMELVRKLEPK